MTNSTSEINQYEIDVLRETNATASFRDLLESNRDELEPIARWGDGEGGYMLSIIKEVFSLGMEPRPRTVKKKAISQVLRTKVFERDMYRCKHCEAHLDLCADHIIAESNGGPTNLGNLQTLCRPCNSIKGAK
jgi:hypothetical protein